MTPRLTEDGIDLVAERFRTLGEPTRLRLLNLLRTEERSVGDLVERLGTSQANVSKHLQLLRTAGFVDRRRVGTTVYYYMADPTVFKLCDLVCGRLEDHHDQRRRALK